MGKVYVLGSGFSASAGFPMSRDILKEIFSENNNDIEIHKLKSWLEYHFFKADPHWTANHNFGEVISRLDLIRYFKPLKVADYHNIEFYEKKLLENFINILSNHRYDILPEPYKNFAGKITDQDTVITFNHDLLLENSFRAKNINYSYLLKSYSTKNTVPILKLHGSVNMSFCPVCLQVQIYITSCPKCKCSLEPLIIAPTFFKSYNIPYLRLLWFQALQKISAADKLFFIGYSLNKDDILSQQLFDFGYRMNPDIKVFIINGSLADISFYKNIYGSKVVNTRMKFEEFMNT